MVSWFLVICIGLGPNPVCHVDTEYNEYSDCQTASDAFNRGFEYPRKRSRCFTTVDKV